jgi:hypothetical protein
VPCGCSLIDRSRVAPRRRGGGVVSVPGRRRPAHQRGRAGQLRGRRRECDPLDYLAEQASGCRVAHAAGVESEMELVYAGLHQLLTPMLDRLERLPAPQANALRTAFGLSPGVYARSVPGRAGRP